MTTNRKQARREAAQKRQAQYDSLSVEQKIAQAQSRRGNSAREIARLEASK